MRGTSVSRTEPEVMTGTAGFAPEPSPPPRVPRADGPRRVAVTPWRRTTPIDPPAVRGPVVNLVQRSKTAEVTAGSLETENG
jgi:hypothetical protein